MQSDVCMIEPITAENAEEALRQLSLTLMEAQRRAEELFLEAEQEAPAEKGA